jgi:hypothetical protein
MRKLLVLSVFAIIACAIYLIRFYTNQSTKKFEKRISTANLLIRDGRQTIALYDNSYTEFKRGSNKTKLIKYSYTVDGKRFDDKKQISVVPQEATFVLTYLPADPAINSQNPKEDLFYLQKSLEKEKNESPLFAWVIITLATGCIILFIRNNKKEIENRISIEEMSRQYQ